MHIGNQIRVLRKKNKISPKKLVLGLCSERTLNYIEEGKKNPEKLLADMLVQRLGKSSDKLELIVSKEIYQLERMQNLFEEALERRNKKRAEQLLEKCEEVSPKSNVYRMFYYRCKGYLSFRIDEDMKTACEWIQKALDTTLPNWKGKALKEYLISTLEMENLLAYAKIQIKLGTADGMLEAEKLLLECREYIDAHFSDGEEHAKVYCKCADLLAEIYLGKNEVAKAADLCEKAICELRDFGITYYMIPLLKKLTEYCNEGDVKYETKETYKIFYDTLNNVYTRYHEEWRFQDSIFKNCFQRTYYLENELIRGGRLTSGLTQEQLIEGIYENPESLSRVESGKASPGKKTFEQLFERLSIEKGRYNTFVATESFEVLELKDEFDVLTSRRCYKEAKDKLYQLKLTLDLTVPENERVIKGLELALAGVLDSVSQDELLNEMLMLLQETYPLVSKEGMRVPLDREVYLLNHISILLIKLSKLKEVEQLYRDVLASMKQSRVKVMHRFRGYSTIATNYALRTGSASLARTNIKYALLCGKCRLIHMNYMTEICSLINHPANYEICRMMLKEAYSLCKLVRNDSDMRKISLYHEKKYGVLINDR